MRCEQVADRLPGVVDGTATLNRPASRHVEQCLRCQAAIVQYRRLHRLTRSLRSTRLEPPADLLPTVLAATRDADLVNPGGTGARRAAYIGGIAAATAAGAAGAIALARSRRLAG